MSLLEQIKNKSLLEQIKSKANREGICETCGHLEQITENAIGCIVLDKLILPEYPPYHGNCKCDSWKKRGA